MKSSPWASVAVAAVLVGLSWWGLVLLEPNGPANEATIGFLLGTLFGQTTLAAAWAAFGPLPWYGRLPLALGWVVLLWLGIVVNLVVHNGPGPDGEFLTVLAACLLGQWLLVQLPLWGLGWAFGLRLVHGSAAALVFSPPPLQFGIRQLMTLTAAVAVMLGAGRAAILLLAERLKNIGGGEPLIFIFLAVAAVVMTVPLLMAALLPRMSVAASLAVVLLIAAATLGELPLLQLLPSRGGGPEFIDFLFINTFTAAWVLTLVTILRLGGYGLRGREMEESTFS